MPFLDLAEGRIEYRAIPAARHGLPQLLLLHEGLGSIGQWRDFPELLAAASGCETILYARRGHGRSAPISGPRRVDYMHVEALQVLAVIRASLGLEHPVLIGHSDGASIALLHAGARRWPVTGLVLFAPHVFVEPKSLAGIRSAAESFRTGDLRARLARHHDDVDQMFQAWSDVWLSPEFTRWNIEEFLSAITEPILMVQEELDPYGTLAQIAAIRAGVSSRLVANLILPGSGHAPFRDHPERVVRAVVHFIQRLGDQ